MFSNSVLDVRAIANVVLDRGDELGIGITNMALNKIVYFVHCDYLIETREPLVRAKIEAWEHGPVFREIYHEFKSWKRSDVRSRAKKVDPFSGELIEARVSFGQSEKLYINRLIDRYINFTAAHLRALSHSEDGPWHKVWGHDGETNPGMKISDELILKYYATGAVQ